MSRSLNWRFLFSVLMGWLILAPVFLVVTLFQIGGACLLQIGALCLFICDRYGKLGK